GLFIIITLFVTGILITIFQSIKFHKTANNLFLSFITIELISSLIILQKTEIDPSYLIVGGNSLLLIGSLINQYTKLKKKETIWILIVIISVTILNHYILTYI
ncbi:MAG: hypothetical protein IKE70_01720, partial [Bacilli bacterium]|nr:hypothetical protein [Bacilli bacterium]